MHSISLDISLLCCTCCFTGHRQLVGVVGLRMVSGAFQSRYNTIVLILLALSRLPFPRFLSRLNLVFTVTDVHFPPSLCHRLLEVCPRLRATEMCARTAGVQTGHDARSQSRLTSSLTNRTFLPSNEFISLSYPNVVLGAGPGGSHQAQI